MSSFNYQRNFWFIFVEIFERVKNLPKDIFSVRSGLPTLNTHFRGEYPEANQMPGFEDFGSFTKVSIQFFNDFVDYNRFHALFFVI